MIQLDESMIRLSSKGILRISGEDGNDSCLPTLREPPGGCVQRTQVLFRNESHSMCGGSGKWNERAEDRGVKVWRGCVGLRMDRTGIGGDG